ncbi:MAG: hypothetical protein QM831_07105 [Kofleriaceae bacterium]
MGTPIHLRGPGADLQEGDRIGMFRITRRIAPQYYEAEDVAQRHRIAIEIGQKDDTRLVDVRFVRAASLLEPMKHPGIARVIDHGALYDERPWLAMKRPHGVLLSELFGAGRLTTAEATAVVRGCASVLAYVHAEKIVHGNLRPHQIVVVDDEPHALTPVCIGGWGSLRSPGIPAFGDPPAVNIYVAPEHLVGPIDQRADIYTLGAIGYRALTGVFPDVSGDLTEPGDLLGELINGMLSKDPRRRPTAKEIVEALVAESPTLRRLMAVSA